MMLSDSKFAVSTKNVRHNLCFRFVDLVAPKLGSTVRKVSSESFVNGLPRPFTKMLKEKFGSKKLIGCEIGFGYGANSESLLSELNIEKLYCVDPYFGSSKYMDNGVEIDWFCKPTSRDDFRMKKVFESCKTEIIRMDSDKAFFYDLIPKGLDFIYIDGCHSYDYCYRDIVNSFEHVRNGGFVGGHDFANGGLVGVYQAVFAVAMKFDRVPVCAFPDFWFEVC